MILLVMNKQKDTGPYGTLPADKVPDPAWFNLLWDPEEAKTIVVLGSNRREHKTVRTRGLLLFEVVEFHSPIWC